MLQRLGMTRPTSPELQLQTQIFVFALSLKDSFLYKLIRTQVNSTTPSFVFVNQFLKNYPKQQFWTCCQNSSQEKTARQLYDYYTNSFSKFLFFWAIIYRRQRNYVTSLERKNVKSETIKKSLKRFGQIETQQYFKHNIIMYVVNLRK
ncbi:Hypothetical_protein [Hexamita inflata]|uniref:Hypothetical_protein n=1 Tax=Hexamita inflata TaxID=28002 RepID=A0AA86PZ66_9EUKA|nr:Hypothetical protein HINF_LOCUS34238 [Hexamita inflata]